MTMPFKSILGALHRAVFTFRYALRARCWLAADARPCPTLKKIVISGFFDEALGIGRAGRLVADGLEVGGYTVIREDLRPFDRGLITRPAAGFRDGADAPIWLIATNPPEAKIALFTHTHAAWKEMYRIGLWHWESSIAPAAWVKAADWFHEIWLSSQFSRDAVAAAMRRAGRLDQISKLRVHPLPVKLPPSKPAVIEKTRVQVLTMFDPRSDFERKNPMAVLHAWMKLFPKPSRTARLVIKSLSTAAGYPHFNALQSLSCHRDDIVLLAQTLTGAQTEALIAESDILVSLHRGEGFGLPLAEAMAAGVAVMATGWSGNLQFMTEDNAILVPYRLVKAVKQYNGPAAQWAEPDVEAAADGLKRLIEMPELRQRLTSRARKDIAMLYDNWLNPDLAGDHLLIKSVKVADHEQPASQLPAI